LKLRFYSLWAINAALHERKLCEQLDAMRGWGFDGVVFHPRLYPNTPPYLGKEYLSILSKVILHAKSISMEFWLYDENGWPSGTVGGELLKQHPDVRQQWLELSETGDPTPRIGAGVDYFDPKLAEHFLAMTHERYRQGLDPAAFEYVSTFFCDEPEFGLGHAFDSLSPNGAIPWTPRLVELYRARYGKDLLTELPLLFFERNGYRQVRVQFWELLTDLFCDSFIEPIDRWCRQHGKRFTAHVKGEEHPLFQVPMHGSAHQVFQHLGLPGIDALERFPSGHFFPRQVASASQQFGNGDCMVECFGGAGWGATPEDLQRYLIWLADHGLNHFVLHLNQYQLTTHAIHDWPASIPTHVNWRDAFPELLERVRQHAALDAPPADVLVVAPYRGIMEEYNPRELLQTNIHNASAYPQSKAGQLNTQFLNLLDRVHRSGTAYHVCDERSIEQHGKFIDGHFQLGHCRYSKVIVAHGARMNAQASKLVERCTGLTGFSQIEISTQPLARTMACDVHWEHPVCGQNLLVLEATEVGPSEFVARFDATTELQIQVVFAEDEVSDVVLNDMRLGRLMTGSSVSGCNEVRFKCAQVAPTPFVSVRGAFFVFSRTPFLAGPNDTMKTDGPFFIQRNGDIRISDLIGSGFPFYAEPIVLRGTFENTSTSQKLNLADVAGDCAHISIDGGEGQWCWGPDWTVAFSAPLAAGQHIIEVRLIPSTFNRYGPHHHIDGDPHIVSPMQYEYIRNFADRTDAPASTRTKAWHFKPLRIGSQIMLG
jgi:hypothetical protein